MLSSHPFAPPEKHSAYPMLLLYPFTQRKALHPPSAIIIHVHPKESTLPVQCHCHTHLPAEKYVLRLFKEKHSAHLELLSYLFATPLVYAQHPRGFWRSPPVRALHCGDFKSNSHISQPVASLRSLGHTCFAWPHMLPRPLKIAKVRKMI